MKKSEKKEVKKTPLKKFLPLFIVLGAAVLIIVSLIIFVVVIS